MQAVLKTEVTLSELLYVTLSDLKLALKDEKEVLSTGLTFKELLEKDVTLKEKLLKKNLKAKDLKELCEDEKEVLGTGTTLKELLKKTVTLSELKQVLEDEKKAALDSFTSKVQSTMFCAV
jgi:hypothetical protein